MRRALVVAAGLLLADAIVAGCAAPPADAYPGEEDQATGLERSLAGVVLLLAELPDGHTRFGAALVLDGRGHALTSAHVVDGARRVRAMLYRGGRVSYTPMDGGIQRLVAENPGDLSEAEVLRTDPSTDLAVISLGADTSHLPVLELAEQLPRPGTRVVAIGHPHEAVWSSTAGMVSSRRDGLLQHDAPLGVGSSGGPLLDARGRVLGINTLKVFGDGEGLAFARPMALALPLLVSLGLRPGVPAPPAPQATR